MYKKQYEMQCYFRDKCRAFYTAYKEAKRLSLIKKKCAGEKFSFEEWTLRTEDEQKGIDKLVQEFKEKGIPIIIYEKEQIVAILSYFSKNCPLNWPTIYLTDQYLKEFPKDKLSQQFLSAYRSGDKKVMVELLKHAPKN